MIIMVKSVIRLSTVTIDLSSHYMLVLLQLLYQVGAMKKGVGLLNMIVPGPPTLLIGFIVL